MWYPSWLPAEWLAQAALGGGVLLLLGAVAMLCTRRPARRQRIAEMALAGSLLIALLSVFAGWLPFSIPLWESEPRDVDPAAVTYAPPIEVVEPPVYLALTMDLKPQENVASDVWTGGGATLPADTAASEATTPFAEETPAPPIVMQPPVAAAPSWWMLIATGYVIVATLLLLWCLLGHLGLWRLSAIAQPVPARVAALFGELTHHWRSPPRLAVSPRVAGPVSFGLWNPTILVPPWFCRKHNAEELRQVLVHELTHLERRDSWCCLLLVLVQAIYFYLPWFWWLRRQVRLCQEYIADAAAASLTSSEDYAQYLVSLSAYRPRPIAGVRVMGVLGSSSDLFRRIAMLCNASDRVERQCPRWWTLLVAGGFGLSAILLSGVSLHAQEKKDKLIRVEEKKVDGEAGKSIILHVDATDGKKPVILRLEDGKLIKDEKSIRAVIDGAPDVVSESIIVVADDEGDAKARDVHKKLLADLQEALERAAKAAHSDKGLDEARKQLEVAQKRLAEAQKQLEEARQRTVRSRVIAPAKIKTEALMKVQDGELREHIRKAIEEKLKGIEDLPADQREEIRKRVAEALKHVDENIYKNVRPGIIIPKTTDKDVMIRKGEPIKELLIKPDQRERFVVVSPDGGGKGRLGIMTEAVPSAVLHHLDLPIGKGLMIVQIIPDTPAAKAGLKEHDIILQFAGKDVPPDSDAFRKIVLDHKGNTADVIVLRKGKSTTIKGIGLAEGSTEWRKTLKDDGDKKTKEGEKKEFRYQIEPMKKLDLDAFRKIEKGDLKLELGDLKTKIDLGELKKLEHLGKLAGGGSKSVFTSVTRKDDHLEIKHKEDDVTIHIDADVQGGKARVNGIAVEEGNSAAKYKTIGEVPEKYRGKVKELLEMSEKGEGKSELRLKTVR